MTQWQVHVDFNYFLSALHHLLHITKDTQNKYNIDVWKHDKPYHVSKHWRYGLFNMASYQSRTDHFISQISANIVNKDITIES